MDANKKVGPIFITIQHIFATFHLLVVIYLKFDIVGPISLLKSNFSWSNHYFNKFSLFGNCFLTPKHDDFSWLAQIFLCQQEILLGPEEILLGQQEILLGQQEILLGQQEILVGQADPLIPGGV